MTVRCVTSGPVEEIGRLAALLAPTAPDDAARLVALRDALVLPDCPVQAVHGDAHLGNVVVTTGPASAGSTGRSRGAARSPGTSPASSISDGRSASCRERDRAARSLPTARTTRTRSRRGCPSVALWAAAWGLVGGLEVDEWNENARRRLAWVDARLRG